MSNKTVTIRSTIKQGSEGLTITTSANGNLVVTGALEHYHSDTGEAGKIPLGRFNEVYAKASTQVSVLIDEEMVKEINEAVAQLDAKVIALTFGVKRLSKPTIGENPNNGLGTVSFIFQATSFIEANDDVDDVISEALMEATAAVASAAADAGYLKAQADKGKKAGQTKAAEVAKSIFSSLF